MIKVAFLHSVAKIGGAERVSQMIMSNLDKTKFECVLVSPETGELSTWATDNGFRFVKLPTELIGLSNLIDSLKQTKLWCSWLRDSRINIIHVADPYSTRAVVLAAWLSKVKVLAHYHFPIKKDSLLWLLKCLPKPSVFVFCSQDLMKTVDKQLTHIAPKSKQLTIHNGVDISRYSPTSVKKDLRKKKHIGIVANLQKRKGHDEFIDMSAILVKKYTNLHFDVIGGDILQEPREAILKQKVHDLKLTSYFTFHGQVTDVLTLLDNLDIVVCASHEEAFPIAILEAMAMQKPIVSTHVNGIPEAIVDSQHGLLVDPYKADELAEAVSKFIDNPEFASQISQRARSRVVKEFDLDSFAKKFEYLYNSLND